MVLKSCSRPNDTIVIRTIIVSSIDHCMPYLLVDCSLNQDVWWHGYGTRMIYRSTFHWADHFRSTLLLGAALMGYGYKYPSDLRLPRWLASNSLCFGARLLEFLIWWWKVSGYSQVLVKFEYESRLDWLLQMKLEIIHYCVSIQQNFGQSSPVRSHRIF